MKKILKFFPVALAAFALASCSNDDLFLGSDEQAQKDPTKLYVTIEDLVDGENGVTRAGFVYNYDALVNPNGQYFAWSKADKVKLYDNNNNWRPQIWQYSEDATIAYAKSGDNAGFAVFENNITEDELPVAKAKDAEGNELPQYTNAYGVMPYTLAKFANETRTKIQFNLDELKYYSLGQEDVADVYEKGKLSKAPIPLWGVANGNEMKVKYLTGILKVDISNVLGDANDNTHSFLIVQATNAAGTNGIKMHPVDIPQLLVDFDPEDIETAPEITTVAGGTKSNIAATPFDAIAQTGENVPEDVIIVDLGNVMGRTCIAVPLLAMDAAQKVSAYLATNVDITGDNVNLTGAQQVGKTKEWTVAKNKYYRIQDAAEFDVTGVNTLNELARKIVELDNQTDRDFTINLMDNINVQAGDDAEGYTLTLDEGLLHNVNLTFKAGYGFKKIGSPKALVVKTSASNDKVLTITNTADSDIPAFEIDAAAAGKIVLQGDLKSIINNANDILTIADGQGDKTEVYTTGRLVFDAYNKTLKLLNIQNGCEKVTIANGKVNVLFCGTPSSKFTGETEVYTEGSGYVATVDYQYVKTKKIKNNDDAFDANIKFTSKLTMAPGTGDYATAYTTITNAKVCASGTKVIISAQQLAKCTTSDGVVLAQSIDLAGNDGRVWDPIVSKALNGYTGVVTSASALDGDASFVNATIKNVKINAAAQAGFFASLNHNVQNLILDNVSIEGATPGVTAGALAATNGANVTVENVELKNININLTSKNNLTTAGPAQAIGGLIGKVTKPIQLLNVDTKGVVSLQGNAAIGGFIGWANDKVTFGAINGTSKKGEKVAKFTTAPTLTPTVGTREFDPTYAMVGKYVGYASDDVEIITAAVLASPAAATKSTLETNNAKWGVSVAGATDYYDIDRKFDIVGFSFYNLAENTPTTTVKTVKVYGYASGKDKYSKATVADLTSNTKANENETITLTSSNKKNPAADAINAKTLVTIKYAE